MRKEPVYIFLRDGAALVLATFRPISTQCGFNTSLLCALIFHRACFHETTENKSLVSFNPQKQCRLLM